MSNSATATVSTPTTPLKPSNDVLGDAVSFLTIGEERVDTFDETAPTNRSKGILGWYQAINDKIQALTAVKTKDKVTFFQLLSVMIGAGVPLVKSLYVLSGQTKNVRLRKALATMAQKVENGKTFSEAMEDFSGIFSDAQVGMIRAGEASGKLNEVLREVATQAEKSEAVGRKVKGAMIYPVVVMTMMGGAVIVILTFVMPKIMELFTQTGGDLPASTRTLMAISDFLRSQYVYIFAGLGAFAFVFNVWKRTAEGRYRWDWMKLHLPIFGLMLRYVALARFTRSLSSLMNSGIPIVKSLQINADAVGNEVYRRRVYLAAEDVSRGIPLAENLMDSNFLFPEMVVSMIAVGEQTAELSKVALKIAEYYDEEVDQMAENMSKLMEPLIMAVMGVVVGGLMIAVMQPIFGLMDVVGSA